MTVEVESGGVVAIDTDIAIDVSNQLDLAAFARGCNSLVNTGIYTVARLSNHQITGVFVLIDFAVGGFDKIVVTIQLVVSVSTGAADKSSAQRVRLLAGVEYIAGDRNAILVSVNVPPRTVIYI